MIQTKRKERLRFFSFGMSLYVRLRCTWDVSSFETINGFLFSSPAVPDVIPTKEPCNPSPCGLNSQCAVSAANEPSCSCLPTYVGSPPNCRPECRVDNECPANRACIRQKCSDPCVGLCGLNALCQVTLHQARCTCPESYTGDPFTVCSVAPCKKIPCYLRRYGCYITSRSVSALRVTKPDLLISKTCKYRVLYIMDVY